MEIKRRNSNKRDKQQPEAVTNYINYLQQHSGKYVYVCPWVHPHTHISAETCPIGRGDVDSEVNMNEDTCEVHMKQSKVTEKKNH